VNYLNLEAEITAEEEPKITTYSDKQIFEILKQYNSGKTIFNLSNEYALKSHTIFNWLSKYEGLDSHSLIRLKRLEAENNQLKVEVAATKFKIDLICKSLAVINVQDNKSAQVISELKALLK